METNTFEDRTQSSGKNQVNEALAAWNTAYKTWEDETDEAKKADARIKLDAAEKAYNDLT